MSEPKDSTSFFRKVVKFVANPTTEWADVGLPQDETRENEFAKSELKAMIDCQFARRYKPRPVGFLFPRQ